MSQRVFDAFVFDLDGTLVDTASELIAAYQKLCIELGGGEKPFDDARKLISHGSGRLVTEATGIEEGDPRYTCSLTYRMCYCVASLIMMCHSKLRTSAFSCSDTIGGQPHLTISH